MQVLTVEPVSSVRGTFTIPGDKSITHRAYLLGGLAGGVTTVRGANLGLDCEASLRAMMEFGARVSRSTDGIRIQGVGGRLGEPSNVVDCGNSGTTMRLVSGIATGVEGVTILTGDESLRKRPMGRIIEPLERMGARIVSRAAGLAPLVIRGGRLGGIEYRLPVPSAQIKSAILLAGLQGKGDTCVIESVVSRDHTERMLRRFGVDVAIEAAEVTDGPGFDVGASMSDRPREFDPMGARRVIVEGGASLTGAEIEVPGDPSAAAFFIVAALITPDSEVTIENVCVNPTRRGIIDALIDMGGQIEVRGATEADMEPVCTIVARSSELRGIEIGGDRIPALIDELPILAVAAAFARGTTTVSEAAELRVKESDRIDLICRNLGACGVRVEERADGFMVHGGARPRGAMTDAMGDHRIAMSMAVMALASEGTMTVRGAANIATSFPEFVEQLAGVGGVA